MTKKYCVGRRIGGGTDVQCKEFSCNFEIQLDINKNNKFFDSLGCANVIMINIVFIIIGRGKRRFCVCSTNCSGVVIPGRVLTI